MRRFFHLFRVKVLRTDHSLHEFSHPGMLLMNIITSALAETKLISHVIAVSHAVRENGVIRLGCDPKTYSVIPNALDPSKFPADPSKRRPLGTINIVFMARMTYRKGKKIQKISNFFSRFKFLF